MNGNATCEITGRGTLIRCIDQREDSFTDTAFAIDTKTLIPGLDLEPSSVDLGISVTLRAGHNIFAAVVGDFAGAQMRHNYEIRAS